MWLPEDSEKGNKLLRSSLSLSCQMLQPGNQGTVAEAQARQTWCLEGWNTVLKEQIV